MFRHQFCPDESLCMEQPLSQFLLVGVQRLRELPKRPAGQVVQEHDLSAALVQLDQCRKKLETLRCHPVLRGPSPLSRSCIGGLTGKPPVQKAARLFAHALKQQRGKPAGDATLLDLFERGAQGILGNALSVLRSAHDRKRDRIRGTQISAGQSDVGIPIASPCAPNKRGQRVAARHLQPSLQRERDITCSTVDSHWQHLVAVSTDWTGLVLASGRVKHAGKYTNDVSSPLAERLTCKTPSCS